MQVNRTTDDHQMAGETAARGEDVGNIDGGGLPRPLSAMDRQYAVQTGVERRVHIVGTGSIGKLVAHSLRGLSDPPPVTLVFHRYKLLEAWEAGRKEVTIEDDGFPVSRGGFDVELMQQVRKQHGVRLEKGTPDVYDLAGEDGKPHEVAQALQQQRQSKEDSIVDSHDHGHDVGADSVQETPIHNLILTTKASYTIPALAALKHRLTPQSTICFLQNGMGIIDDVNTKLFPNIDQRPNYMQGIITHGVNVPPAKAEQDPFFAVHAGAGTISLGLLPRQSNRPSSPDDQGGGHNSGKEIQSEKWAPSSRYLLRTLTRSPVLCAVGFTPLELLQQQLEKLAVNSVLNPLTALLDNRNGSLLYNFALTRTLRLMLAETSLVIRSLPELQGVPNVNLRFGPERLETLAISVANKTKDNISSMLADVRGGRTTEINFINGYIVRRGEELGIKCVVNYAIMQTVIGKAEMTKREVRDEVPMEGSKRQLHND